MKTRPSARRLKLALALLCAACALPALAQSQPGAPAAVLAPVAAAGTDSAPAAPKKRRAARILPASDCEPVNDPWQNICTIRKNAQTACGDLDTPTRAAPARKRRTAPPAPVVKRDLRQECIDAYMRNV
jgi:hypothetical protein